MDDEPIDKTVLKKIHGYISCSDDDSESDSKVELDEMYEQNKPPPIPIDPTVDKIIEIGPEDDEDYKTSKHMLYSSALKVNLKTGENNACVVVNAEKENTGAKKKKRVRKKKKNVRNQEGILQDSNNLNIVKVDVIENMIQEENCKTASLRENEENPKINDEAYKALQNSGEWNFVQVDDLDGVKLSKNQRNRQRKALKKRAEVDINRRDNDKSNLILEGFDNITSKNTNYDNFEKGENISSLEFPKNLSDKETYSDASLERTSDGVGVKNGNNQKDIVVEKCDNFETWETVFMKNEEYRSDTYFFEIKNKVGENQQNGLRDFSNSETKEVAEEDNCKQEVVKIKKKKRNKTKSKVPSEGLLLSMFDSEPLYQSHYAYNNPNFENFRSFKESFLNGSKQNDKIFEKLSKLLKNYQNHVNIFLEKHPTDAFRVFVASQVFLKSTHQLDIKVKPLRVNCTLIGKIAAIFSNFAKSQKNLNYRNSDLLKNRVDRFSSEVDTAFETIIRTEYLRENFWDSLDDFSDTVVCWINKILTDILENLVIRCKIKLNPGEIYNEETYSAINMVAKYENIFKIFEGSGEKSYEKEVSDHLSMQNLSHCEGDTDLTYTEPPVQNANLTIVSQNGLSSSIIEDLTENRKYFYDSDLNLRKWQKFQTEYFNKETSSLLKPKINDNDQSHLNHLILGDLTQNRKYFYDFHSKPNVRKWRNFQKKYLNEGSASLLILKSESELPSTTIEKSSFNTPQTITFLEYPLLWIKNVDIKQILAKLILLVLLKNIVFWLFYHLIILLINVAYNGIDVVFLILVLLYLCTFFVIKF